MILSHSKCRNVNPVSVDLFLYFYVGATYCNGKCSAVKTRKLKHVTHKNNISQFSGISCTKGSCLPVFLKPELEVSYWWGKQENKEARSSILINNSTLAVTLHTITKLYSAVDLETLNCADDCLGQNSPENEAFSLT